MICYKFGWYSIFYQRQKKTTELCQFEPVVIYFKYDFLWIGSKGKPFRDMYQLLNIHVLYWLSSITPCMKTLVHQGSYENWRIIKSVFVVYGTEMIYSFTWFIANNLNFISLFLLWYRFPVVKYENHICFKLMFEKKRKQVCSNYTHNYFSYYSTLHVL